MEIKTCVENQRTYFKTHATLSYAFRYEALTLLQRVIRDHELEIMEALKQDLGKSNFESYMSEIGIVLEELNYAKKTLKTMDETATCADAARPVSGSQLYPGRAVWRRVNHGALELPLPADFESVDWSDCRRQLCDCQAFRVCPGNLTPDR